MLLVIMCIFIGILLGGAQELTSLILNHKNELRELYPYIMAIIAFYGLATYQWIRILRSELNLSNSYALVVLGVFIGFKVTSLFTRHETTNFFSLRDIFGIVIIFLGSLLIKR